MANLIVESLYAKYDAEELTEARNPENDEINKIIARCANRHNISPEDRAALEDAGIKITRKGLVGKNGRMIRGFRDMIVGPMRSNKPYWNVWPKDGVDNVDLKNYLDKPVYDELSYSEEEAALRPYSDNYRYKVARKYNDEKRAQEWTNRYYNDKTGREYLSDDDIEAQVQEYKQLLQKYDLSDNDLEDALQKHKQALLNQREEFAAKLARLEQAKHDYVANAKNSHADKMTKNESLTEALDVADIAENFQHALLTVTDVEHAKELMNAISKLISQVSILESRISQLEDFCNTHMQ